MGYALAAAGAATATGDVPVGAVVLDPAGRLVSSAANAREATGDPTAHAEIIALRERRGGGRLSEGTLPVHNSRDTVSL